MQRCSVCPAKAPAAGELCRCEQVRPVCAECLSALGGDNITDASIDALTQQFAALGMPIKRGWDEEEDEDFEPVRSPGRFTVAPVPPPPSSSTVAPAWTSASEVLVYVRWRQWSDHFQWRYKALVSPTMTARQLFAFLATSFGESDMNDWSDKLDPWAPVIEQRFIADRVSVINLDASGDDVAGQTLTVLGPNDQIGPFINTNFHPPRLGVSRNLRGVSQSQPEEFDEFFYGKVKRDGEISFTVDCAALDRECDVPPVPLDAPWSEFLDSAEDLYPALRSYNATLAGRTISRILPFRAVPHMIDARTKIYDTLNGYVSDPDGGVRIVFE